MTKVKAQPETDERVLVIPRAVLFAPESERVEFQGFSSEVSKYLPVFTSEYLSYRPRSTVETEVEFKQLIPYSFFQREDKILCYQRTSKAGEARLHNKWSIGFGGHMNDGDDNLMFAIIRELLEEINLSECGKITPTYIGFINDDTNEVGQVHLGLAVKVDIEHSEVKPSSDKGLSNISWKTPEELLTLELENWSKILLENLNISATKNA